MVVAKPKDLRNRPRGMSSQNPMGLPNMRKPMSVCRRWAASDRPYGPAPAIAMSTSWRDMAFLDPYRRPGGEERAGHFSEAGYHFSVGGDRGPASNRRAYASRSSDMRDAFQIVNDTPALNRIIGLHPPVKAVE